MSSQVKPKAQRLLVVDDEYFNYEMLEAALKSNFDMSYADSGESCLASAIANPPEIILLDVCMPGLDGYDTCRMLKHTPETKNIPVIMLSGLESPIEKQAGFDAGCDAYVVKPFSINVLREQINLYIERTMLTQDKRNFRRMQLNTVANLTTIEPVAGLSYTAECVDLSATGLSLQLDDLLELNTILSVDIASTHPSIEPLKATAKVIRASKEDDGTITAGLEIIQID